MESEHWTGMGESIVVLSTAPSSHVQESGEQELKPLRYNPGLKCDPELEAMRPERLNKHTGERWAAIGGERVT